MHRNHRSRAPLALALACTLHALPATPLLAATRTWGGTTGITKSGNWAFLTNWSPLGLPTTGDDVVISTAGTVDSVITYDYAGVFVTTNSLLLDNTGPASPGAAALLNMPSLTLSSTTQWIGYNGRATFAQSGGINFATNLYLGLLPNSQGSYTLANAALLQTANTAFIGYSGQGSLLASGGTFLANGGLVLGNNAGSAGSLSLTGSATLSAANNVTLASFGTARLQVAGGTLNVNTAADLTVAANTGAAATLSLSSGAIALNATSNAYIGRNAGSVGSLLISGGSFTLNDTAALTLGANAGSFGALTISAGSLTASSSYNSCWVGDHGAGAVAQSGPSLVSVFSLQIGRSSGSSGSYALSGGTLTTAIALGLSGTGTFNQSGGFASFSGFQIALDNAGTYTLSAGTLTASYLYLAQNGQGAFLQSGGVFSVGNAYGALLIALNASGTGSYSLSGNAFLTANSAEGIGYRGTATFIQSGGSHLVRGDDDIGGALVLGNESTGSGSYALSQSAALEVQGDVVVGVSGTGAFSQSGGTHTIDNASLVLGRNPGSKGTYTLSAGTLHLSHLSSEIVGDAGAGVFLQTGGTHLLSGVDGLSIAHSSGAGTYTLAGGLFSSPAVTVYSAGRFLYNAGSLSLGTLSLQGGRASFALPASLSALQFFGNGNSWKGQLDLQSALLILQTTGPADKAARLPTLASQILSAKNGNGPATWTASGITSSTVAANPAQLTLGLFDNADLNLPSYAGQPLDANALLLVPTQLGDANLDHHVDLADYDLWYKHVGSPGNATSKGDFNLDGQIDLADYDAWYSHVGTSFPLLSPQSSALSTDVSPIPEPTSLALLALPLLFPRRR